MLWWILGGFAAVIVLFLVWRMTSVSRGARQRDAAIVQQLTPLLSKLDQGHTVTPDEVAAAASAGHVRVMLYHALAAHRQTALFPTALMTPEKQAEAWLTYWMMHPNELQNPPARIETIAALTRTTSVGEGTFYVMRYQMPPGHWAGDKWILGVAGPFTGATPPFAGLVSAFSSCDDFDGVKTHDQVVDRFIEIHGLKPAA